MKTYVNQLAKVISVECSDALADYNDANNTMRVTVNFVYQAQQNENDDSIDGLLANCSNDNRGNVIIDIEQFDGKNFDEKLNFVKNAMVDKFAHFTTLICNIDELLDDGTTTVNNGERDYSSLKIHFIGNADIEESKKSLLKRLNNQLADGTLMIGSVNDAVQQPTRRGTR